MMNKSNPKDTYKSAVVTILKSLSVPLSNLISQLIKTTGLSNQQDTISDKFIDFLARSTLFDSSIDCLIDRFISFLLMDPEECFPILFTNIPQVNLDMNSRFSIGETKSSLLLSRIESEFPNPTLLSRCTAYFVIDKLYVVILLRFLEKLDEKSHPPLTYIFTELLFSFTDQESIEISKVSNKKNLKEIETVKKNFNFKRKNENEIRSINIKQWCKIIHKLSILQPIESFYFFVENLLNGNKNKQDWSFSFNLYRCFDFGCLYENNINSLAKYEFFDNIIKSSFQKVSFLDNYHVSSSLFLMNLVGYELVIKKRNDSLLIKEILNFVNDSFAVTPVSLPIAAVFAAVNSPNLKLNLKFSANQVVSNALNMISQISGSSILILNTFSQLFLCNQSFFNDIYSNGIKIPNNFSEFSLISKERRQNIFQKIVSYGSFNNALLELTNFFVSFAYLDFHSFVESNLKEMVTPIFMRFNSFAAFYFFREILLNEMIKEKFSEDFSLFESNMIDILSKHIESNPPITKEKVIYSMNSWIFNNKSQKSEVKTVDFDICSDFEKQNCCNDYFLKHIFEFVEPKSVSFPSANTKIKNDILLWLKLFCGKIAKLFSEEKNLQQMQNCKMLKENQSTALLFSLIPLLKVDEKVILSIVPYIYDFSPQISAISVFVIQLAIRKNPNLIEKVIDLMISQDFSIFEVLYNTLYFISIFISACFSSLKNKNEEFEKIMKNVFDKIQQILIIGLCSNRNEIRSVTFSVIDLLNIDEFKILDNNQCFKQFLQKLKALTFPSSLNVKISQMQFRSYRDISQTKYETIHSIYLSVIFDHLKIEFEDKELKIINNLYHSIKLKLNDIEYKHFLINIATFLASKSDNDDSIHSSNNLYQELNNFKENDHLLISFASSFNDVMSFTNYFSMNLSDEMQISLFPSIALILWERFPTDNTINIFLVTIPKIIEKSFKDEINKFKENQNENNEKIENNLNSVICILTLLSKMFSTFLTKHKILSSSIFLRNSVCDDIFRFCHCEEKKEIIFEFCLYCSNIKSIQKVGIKALESFCSVTFFLRKQIHYFEYLKNYPKAVRSIFCQSPQIIEILLDQIKSGDKSSFSTISALFYPISSIIDSTDAIAENLSLLYYNYCCNAKNIKDTENSSQKDSISEITNDIEFSNIIYNMTGKIIAICLWNFPSNDSINTLLNLTLSFALIRIFLLNEKEKNLFKNEKEFIKIENNNVNNDDKENKNVDNSSLINDFASLIHFLNNPSNNIQTLSNLLCSPFEFCLDQFLKQSFDLLNISFSSNFVLALTPWMNKIDLNLGKENNCLSPNTENYFKFCLTSITFIETIDKFKLYELIDMIINLNNENIESLFVLGIYLKKPELIQRIVKNAPKCIDYICYFFNCNFWRYQVVQLRKLGDKFYNESTIQFLSISTDSLTKSSNSKNIDNNDDIFDITYFLLKEVVPKLITDNLNELDFIYSNNQAKRVVLNINDDINNSTVFDHEDDSEFLNSYKSSPSPNKKQNKQPHCSKIKSLLNHILSFCVAFEKKAVVYSFLKNYPHIFHFFELNDTTFNLLFQWATICGDIDASNSASLYLVKNFDKFSLKNKSLIFTEFNINRIMQTITILTLSIHSRNTTKNNQITGDRQFQYTPYYTFISTLMKLLSIFDENYFQLKNDQNQLNSKIFWFFCEFLVASDKDFGPIFGVVTDSLHKHLIKKIPINDSSYISPQKFEGILPLIVKHDSIVSKNDSPQAIDQIIEISKILFKNDKLYHLIGNLNRFEQPKNDSQKNYISTAGMFLFPFCDTSNDGDSIIISKIIEAFDDDEIKFDSIQKVVEKMLNYVNSNLIEIIFCFYLFIVKNHQSLTRAIYDACTIILNCKNVFLDCNDELLRKRSNIIVRKSSQNSNVLENSNNNLTKSGSQKVKIHKDNFLRIVQNALRDVKISNASSACSFIQAFHDQGGSFEEYRVPSHDSKFPVENLPFDLDELFESNENQHSKFKGSNSAASLSLAKNESNLLLNKNQSDTNSIPFSTGDIDMMNSSSYAKQSEEKIDSFDQNAVYFPTDSEFISLKFVVDVQEAACARCKIQPFTKWDEDLFNAERARDKIESCEDQPLFDDFESSNKSEYRFDFTNVFASRFYGKLMHKEKISIKKQKSNDEIENTTTNNNNKIENNQNNNRNDVVDENKNDNQNIENKNLNADEMKNNHKSNNNNNNENKNDLVNNNNNGDDNADKNNANSDEKVGSKASSLSDFNAKKVASNNEQSHNNFVMNDVCNKFRHFVKQSLIYHAYHDSYKSFSKLSREDFSESSEIRKISDMKNESQFFDESSNLNLNLHLSQESNDKKAENSNNKNNAESLFFVSPLLFTPNEKDIDSIGPNEFPSVFPC